MRTLIVSKFLHHVGGVETYTRWLSKALQADGHKVAVLGMSPPRDRPMMHFGDAEVYQTPGRTFVDGNFAERALSAANSIYSRRVQTIVREAVATFRPDVVHYHGTCYQLTSSAVAATKGLVRHRLMTAHEYKLSCANQRLWSDRAESICTRCVSASRVDRVLNPIRTRCIKGSVGASAVGGVEAAVSDAVWRAATDIRILAPSMFMHDLLLRDGWGEERVSYLDLPWVRQEVHRSEVSRRDVLYLGRLAIEKDVATMLRGWTKAFPEGGPLRLVVAGDGAAAGALQDLVRAIGARNIEFVGRLDQQEVEGHLHRSAATVHPAKWLENSPFAVRESLMAGVPAMVARQGGMPELVEDGRTGRIVEHSVDGWSEAFSWAAAAAPDLAGDSVLERVGRTRISEEDHLRSLIDFYGR